MANNFYKQRASAYGLDDEGGSSTPSGSQVSGSFWDRRENAYNGGAIRQQRQEQPITKAYDEPQPQEEKKGFWAKAKDWVSSFGQEIKKVAKPAGQQLLSTIKTLPIAVPDIYTIDQLAPKKWQVDIMRKIRGEEAVNQEQYDKAIAIWKKEEPKRQEDFEDKWLEWSMKDRIKAQEFLAENPIEADTYEKFGDKIKDPQWVARGLTMNLPNFAVTTGVGLLTGGVGVIPTAIMLEGGNFYVEAREEGVSDEEATRLATGYGVLAGIVEALVPGELGEGKIVTRLLKGGLKKELIGTVVRTGLEGGTEIVQEVLANAFKRSYNENQDLFAGWKEAGFFGLLMGAMGDGGIRVLEGGKVIATGIKFNKEGTEIINQDESIMDADDIIDKIIDSKAQDTPQGKEILKVALEAQKTDQSVRINTTDGKLTLEIVDKNTTNIPENIQKQVSEMELDQTRLESILNGQGATDGSIQGTTESQVQQVQEISKTYSQEPVVEQKVFRGSKGKVTEQNVSFERTLVVPKDQYDFMKRLAEAGNEDAKAHIESLPANVKRVDYGISDRIIREAFRGQFDAIQYNNSQLKSKGKEWHDLENNAFYAEEKLVADQYAKQGRQDKYEKTKESDGVQERSGGKAKPGKATKKKTEIKKRTEAQTRADKINEYIDNKKTTKFREGEINTIEDVEESAVTSKFLESPQIKNLTKGSYSFLDNFSRSNKLGLKPKEQIIIKRVLDKNYLNDKNINMKDFRRLVIGELMPLNTIKSSTYADYGSDNIDISADNTTTYIMDAPYKHGKTGHFSSDFKLDIDIDQVEIKEIPAQEGNPRAKWAVLQKGVELTEANIQDNVFTVATSKENAQEWINQHSQEVSGRFIVNNTKSGLFSHYRSFDVNEIAHIAEIQSDSFQNISSIDDSKRLAEAVTADENVLENDQAYLKRMETQLERAIGRKDQDDIKRFELAVKGSKEEVSNAEARVEHSKKARDEVKEISKEKAQFLEYKNIWHERTVRESIRTKALEGFETIRFPTPRTIAFIEGYTSEDGGMPYEVTSANDEERLTYGDLIEYGGEEMMVIDADQGNITVAPSGEVNNFLDSEARSEDIDNRIEDVQSEFEDLEEIWGKVDTQEKAQFILDSEDSLKKLSEYTNKAEDLEREETNLKNDGDIATEEEAIKKHKKSIEDYTKFKKLLNDGVIEKEGITAETIHDLSFKDKLEEKYGIDHGYWNYLIPSGLEGRTNIQEAKVEALETADRQIEEYEFKLSQSEKRLRQLEAIFDDRIKKIKARTKPTAKELKGIPKVVIDKTKENRWNYGLGEEEVAVRQIAEFGAVEEADADGVYVLVEKPIAWGDIEDDVRESMEEDYEPDYEGIYENVFFEQQGNDTMVYTAEGQVEQFQQPDDYEPAVGIEEFEIEDYASEQQTVLRFYERQLNRYIKKLRKGNIELVEDDRGFEWYESKLSEADKNATIAFRIKDDLADVGLNITDQQEQEIIDLNKKIFGDDDIKITSQILANNKALGSYSQKMIEVLGKQTNPKDTFFHEAVHKYIDVFTTKAEQFGLFEEGMKRYKTDDMALVEEKIAEDFIKYANNAKSIKGVLGRFFKKIFSRIKAFNKNASKIEKMYEEIITGKAKETSILEKAKKYKSAEEFVKSKPVYHGAIGEKTKIGWKDIKSNMDVEYTDALNKIRREGVKATTDSTKPIEVYHDLNTNKYYVIDGNHRVANIINKFTGRQKIAHDFNPQIDANVYSGRLKGSTDGVGRQAFGLLEDKMDFTTKQQLTDIYNKAQATTKTKPGTTKVSKVAVSIEQNLNERFENLAGFESRTVKGQSKLVSQLIANDIDKVRDIVTGKEPLPAGMSGSMFIAGVEKYVETSGDLDLLRSMATSPLVSETSIHASELRLLREREKNSVLSKVQDLANERAKIFKRRHKKITEEKAIKAEVKKIKESVKKVSKYDWNTFIQSIEC